jgi:hypothetical protein
MTKARDLSQVPNASLGFKNRIINGAMMIDQRNLGASTTTTGYKLDRFFIEFSGGGVFSSQQVTDAPSGFTNSFKATVTTADSSIDAGNNYQFFQQIEGFNAADLGFGTANAATVTLSFWVKSSITGTHSGSLANGSDNRAYVYTYTVSAANTWEYKTITITGDTTGTWLTTNEKGLKVTFNLGGGTDYQATSGSWLTDNAYAATGSVQVVSTLNAIWQITGVQLEKGSTATSWDTRSYGTELDLCQRYYWSGRWDGGACADDDYVVNALGGQFSTTMRATPTVTITSGGMSGHHGTAPDSTFAVTTDGAGFSWSGSAYRSIGARAFVVFNASAEL